jgi:hypothetical protein
MQCILYKIYFLQGFSYVLQIDMHFICTPMWIKIFVLVKSGCYRIHVYLRVSLTKGVKRFGMKRKLAPRYIRPFTILEKCETVAYKLDLSPSLAGVHNIFHMSQLKKCLKAPIGIMLPEVTLLEANLSYPKHPVKVLDQKDPVPGHKTIKFFKIQWSSHTEEEAT